MRINFKKQSESSKVIVLVLYCPMIFWGFKHFHRMREKLRLSVQNYCFFIFIFGVGVIGITVAEYN